MKGAWRAWGTLAPERLNALRRVATIESIGSSTRIEGSQLDDREVEALLSKLNIRRFDNRDKQEVAGYADVMETVFRAFENIALTENHLKRRHRDLLRYSVKDERHRGEYKTLTNDVAAFDDAGKMIGIVFKTATLLYAYVPYSSLESVIEQNKEEYYLALHFHPHRHAELGALAHVRHACDANNKSVASLPKSNAKKSRSPR